MLLPVMGLDINLNTSVEIVVAAGGSELPVVDRTMPLILRVRPIRKLLWIKAGQEAGDAALPLPSGLALQVAASGLKYLTGWDARAQQLVPEKLRSASGTCTRLLFGI